MKDIALATLLSLPIGAAMILFVLALETPGAGIALACSLAGAALQMGAIALFTLR